MRRFAILLACVCLLPSLPARAADGDAPAGMERSILEEIAAHAERELHDGILPFWMHRVKNPAGGFFGEIRADLSIDGSAPRGALMTCRILWAFSAGYRHTARIEYRTMADWAYQDLTRTFWDEEHGGLFWSASPAGAPLVSHKQTYLQTFGIYALTEYYQATGDPVALQRAQRIFRLLEAHARDATHGGYLEAFSRDWSHELPDKRRMIGGTAPKSQNTHLHVMEAYTALARAWPETEPREALRNIIGLMLDHILNPETHHLGLYFESDWRPASTAVSYGHDIEASWLLCAATDALGDRELRTRARHEAVAIARAVMADGITPLGGIAFEGSPSGITNASHEWWSQAEAVVGFLNAYALSGDATFLHAARDTWAFIESHVIDHERGEWFLMVDAKGRPLSGRAKASLWKCPYHNSRACLEIIDRVALRLGK